MAKKKMEEELNFFHDSVVGGDLGLFTNQTDVGTALDTGINIQMGGNLIFF